MPEYACPSCRGALVGAAPGWRCARENLRFDIEAGIPDFILPDRREAIETFLTAYRKVRTAEGWGSTQARYYRDLPYTDHSGKHTGIWRIRARTFGCFLDRMQRSGPIAGTRILDIGAGNCWLTVQLAARGAEVVPVDINLDSRDGLGALHKFPAADRERIVPVRADFDALPFPDDLFDVVIFNASLHYSPDVPGTVRRAMRVLKTEGSLYVLDSPLYNDVESGAQMIRERDEEFQRRYHVATGSAFAGSVLNAGLFRSLAPSGSLEFIAPRYGLLWSLRPFAAKLLRRREPASFGIIVVAKGKRA